ncbi:DUF500-domain-containing protein [Rhizopus microsporus var. microsporus]|uniref:DUF500-domain-containing protein n=1 Tax=Rhizopus microsporus var. microsporus TaxID=86635 RepID=A0A1X0RCE7_RHIZD|nr:DUF500-domain-containing protein [Rhizopus microsporus var. microsporus]
MPKRSPKELCDDVQQAVQILDLFTNTAKNKDLKALIPQVILQNAHGLLFIRLIRVGMALSVKGGTGIIIARLPDGSWSAPSGISISSFGLGQMFGGEVIDSIIVMNYRAAVKAFVDGGGQLSLGVGVSIAAGPYGRSADVSTSMSRDHIAATYSYSSSKGFYFGYSMEGSKISERVGTNTAFYGRTISAREILTGAVPPPAIAEPLYNKLEALGAGRKVQRISYMAPPVPSAQVPSAPRFSLQRHRSDVEDAPPSYDSVIRDDQSRLNTSDYASSFHTRWSKPLPSPQPISNNIMPYTNDIKHRPNTAITHDNYSPGPFFANETKHLSGPTTYDSHSFVNKTKQPSGPTTYDSHSFTSPFEKATTITTASTPLHQGALEHTTNSNNAPFSLVIAKYDYSATRPNDLSFSAGDHIIVTKRLPDRNCWWEGEIGNRRGFFPANYTEDCD